MRSSLILGVALLLTIAAPSIVQACKGQCGNLGPGNNACKCGEIVVKAAKVQKPLFYASPEAINEAAAAREAVGRLSVGTDRWQSESASFPKYKPCGATFNSCGSSSSSSSSSISSISSSSSSSSSSSNSRLSSLSSLSSGGIFGGLVGGSGSYLPFNSATGRVASSCGCGKTSESLEVRDLLSSNVQGKVVPSFAPIGDLCYPSPPNSKFQVTTKVIPASPGKIKCAPPIPYEVCVQVLNGQINKAGLRKLGLASAYSGTGATVFDRLTSGSAAMSGAAARYGGFGSFGGYRSYGGAGASSSAGSTAYGYGSYGAASGIGQSSSRASSFAGNNLATSSNVGTIQGSATSYRSNSQFTDDFGDDPEFPEDYSYPRLPADPVSVTLAYKNLFPRTVYYNRRAFVPEDKLAFGHRTVPAESCIKSHKNIPDVPEERLQILDKPVVELKPVSPIPITVGAYDEHEEAKLAELEAIERERINQEEIAERQQENFITYGDLGYAPINRVYSGKPLSAGPINAEDDTGAHCGPVGPPIPDYVPGSVVIDRELVEHDDEAEDDVQKNNGSKLYVRHYAGDETSDEEDDCDDPTSGIFARLRSVARKSHGYPRGAV